MSRAMFRKTQPARTWSVSETTTAFILGKFCTLNPFIRLLPKRHRATIILFVSMVCDILSNLCYWLKYSIESFLSICKQRKNHTIGMTFVAGFPLFGEKGVKVSYPVKGYDLFELLQTTAKNFLLYVRFETILKTSAFYNLSFNIEYLYL